MVKKWTNLRRAGAALKRADVRSGPPLFEAGLCGLGRCVGLFVVVLHLEKKLGDRDCDAISYNSSRWLTIFKYQHFY